MPSDRHKAPIKIALFFGPSVCTDVTAKKRLNGFSLNLKFGSFNTGVDRLQAWSNSKINKVSLHENLRAFVHCPQSKDFLTIHKDQRSGNFRVGNSQLRNVDSSKCKYTISSLVRSFFAVKYTYLHNKSFLSALYGQQRR
jgi:hypothetical protein